jgi:ATP-dependent HslUV protease, peptidase subunit HslV
MGKSWHHTTICAVRRDGVTAIACDGQVTLGNSILKHSATKLRRLAGGRVLAGFAGSVADALSLFSRFEVKLEEYAGNLERAAVELARDWRTDKVLRQLEAMMIVADPERVFLLSGTGEVLTPDDGVLAIGSGGAVALAAARALLESSELDARAIVERSLNIAADICIYTNRNLLIDEIR